MKKQKVLKVLGAAALVGLTSLTMTSCSLTDWIGGIIHPTEKPETPTPDEDNKQDSGNVIVDGKELGKDETVDHMPQAIAFRRASNDVSAQSAQGATVTFNATVTPDNATNKSITWSLAWNGSDSGNVNDYVSLNITNETHTVTVTCNKVFNTQIKLTGKTSGGQTATATIDILKRYTKGQLYATRYEDGGQGPYSCKSDAVIDLTKDNNVYKDYDAGADVASDYLCFGNGTTLGNDRGDEQEISFGFDYNSIHDSTQGTIGTPKMVYTTKLTSEFETFLKSKNATELLSKKSNDEIHDNENTYDLLCIDLGFTINGSTPNYENLLFQLKTLRYEYFSTYDNENYFMCQMDYEIISSYNNTDYTLATGTCLFNYNIDAYVKTSGITISNSSSVITK